MKILHRGYEIDDDPARVDVDAVWAFLSTEAYWARWRTRADVDAQIAASWRVVGAYGPDGSQVGFARAFSDTVSLAYLADLYVLPDHRGHGLGHALTSAMIDEGPGQAMRWLLHTRDAHGMYATHGFAPADVTVMERPRPEPS